MARASYTYDDVVVSFEDGLISAIKPNTAKVKARGRSAVSDLSPDQAAAAESGGVGKTSAEKNVKFQRDQHPSALYFGPIPVEFDNVVLSDFLKSQSSFSAVNSARTARSVFRDLRMVLRKYPVQMLDQHLNTIYFVKEIRDLQGNSLPGALAQVRQNLDSENPFL